MTVCVGYRTVLLEIDPEVVVGADALVLASGSSAESWVASVGLETPPVVVAIGPTTAEAARRFGLKISSVAADHSLAGLVIELERQLAGPTGSTELSFERRRDPRTIRRVKRVTEGGIERRG